MDNIKADLLELASRDAPITPTEWMDMYTRVFRSLILSTANITNSEAVSRAKEYVAWREEVPEARRATYDRLTAYTRRVLST